MKKNETFTLSRSRMPLAVAALIGLGTFTEASAQGFLGNLFKKDKTSDEVATVNPPAGTVPENVAAEKQNARTVLTPGQLTAQEGTATQILARAQAEENSQNYGKAYSTYKSIVKNYPRTQAAAESQYKMGEMREAEGNEKKAFEEYQDLITLYKNSPRFNSALNRQFTIAESLKASSKKGFGGIGAAIQPSRLIEMFQQIADSAPYTEFAPRSLLSIGQIHAQQGETPQAIMAFQSVADNYQNTQFGSEAQFQVFKLRGKMAERSFSPVDDRAQEEAGLDFVGKNPGDNRASDVKAQLGEIEDRKLDKIFNVGRFYEGQKQPKSAAVYYREIIKHPGATRYADAKERLAAIEGSDPTIAAEGRAASVQRPIELPGTEPENGSEGGSGLKKLFSGFGKKSDVDEEASYLGPPPPTVDTQKPQMRTSGDDVIPIPNDDPVN